MCPKTQQHIERAMRVLRRWYVQALGKAAGRYAAGICELRVASCSPCLLSSEPLSIRFTSSAYSILPTTYCLLHTAYFLSSQRACELQNPPVGAACKCWPARADDRRRTRGVFLAPAVGPPRQIPNQVRSLQSGPGHHTGRIVSILRVGVVVYVGVLRRWTNIECGALRKCHVEAEDPDTVAVVAPYLVTGDFGVVGSHHKNP